MAPWRPTYATVNTPERTITVRLTRTEFAAVDARARAAGISRAAWVYALVLRELVCRRMPDGRDYFPAEHDAGQGDRH
jgi:hypothetical protein